MLLTRPASINSSQTWPRMRQSRCRQVALMFHVVIFLFVYCFKKRPPQVYPQKHFCKVLLHVLWVVDAFFDWETNRTIAGFNMEGDPRSGVGSSKLNGSLMDGNSFGIRRPSRFLSWPCSLDVVDWN